MLYSLVLYYYTEPNTWLQLAVILLATIALAPAGLSSVDVSLSICHLNSWRLLAGHTLWASFLLSNAYSNPGNTFQGTSVLYLTVLHIHWHQSHIYQF